MSEKGGKMDVEGRQSSLQPRVGNLTPRRTGVKSTSKQSQPTHQQMGKSSSISKLNVDPKAPLPPQLQQHNITNTLIDKPTNQTAQFKNLEFFRGNIKSTGMMTINEMLELKGNYTLLERNHDYIQWLFPNLFKSRFNNDSYPLSQEEIGAFKEDKEANKRYIEGFHLFMDFLGFDHNPQTEELVLISLERLKQATVVHKHNLLRIRRVLASLIALGYNGYAALLIEAMKKQQPKLYQDIYCKYDQKNKDKFDSGSIWPAPSLNHQFQKRVL